MNDFEKFRNKLNANGLAKSNLMDVFITPPSILGLGENTELTEHLSFKCIDAELPGKTFETSEVMDYVITRSHVLGVSYADLNLTFLCSSNMEERKFFDNWMEKILGTNTKRVSYYDDYISKSIQINLYTGRISKTNREKSCMFTIKNAFPVGITAQDISWDNEQILKLTVNFNYEKWEVEYYGQ